MILSAAVPPRVWARTLVLKASAALTTLLPATLHAQEPPAAAPVEEPRIGLVLSGGGARGFAHLGVLKVLHEMRVPVHVVAGTSMGSVVGGLYALGTPYPELERLFRAEDWIGMFRDDPPRSELPMRRKRTEREYALGLEVGLGLDGVRLPPSLVTGSRLNNALRSHTWRPGRSDSFDSLPIPYRAVAMDMEDGSMVVLDHGDLAASIRASMAVPEAFAPQEIEGRRLVDGGMVRNIPVDVAREMGVDVLIVSDVSTGLDEAGAGENALTLASRLLAIVTTRPSLEQLETLGPEDLYLKPDLHGIASSDFSALDAALAAGEAVARAHAERLAALSIPADRYDALVAERARALPIPASIRPAVVRVDTTGTTLAPGVIEALLRVRAGETLTLGELRTDLARVHGYGGFQGVEYRVEEAADGQEILEVVPRDKSWGPVLLRTGLSLLDRERGAGGWSLRSRVEWTRLTSLGGEGWFELELGTRQAVRTRLHAPLVSSERIFLTGTASAGRREVAPVDLFVIPVDADLVDREATVGVGLRLGTWGEARATLAAGNFDLELNTIVAGETPRERFRDRSLQIAVEGDVLDRAYFPASGHRFALSWRRGGTGLGGTAAFHHLMADGLAAVSTGHHTFTAAALLSTGLGTEVPLHRAPALGGFERVVGAPRDALWGGYAGMARVGWSYRLGHPAREPGDGGLRFGISAEAAQAWQTLDEVEVTTNAVRFGGSAWVGVQTPLGPLRVAWAKLEGARGGWIIQVGVDP